MPERSELDRALAEGSLLRDAYFKACSAIARRDDLRFFLRVAGPIPSDMRTELLALLEQWEVRKATPAEVDRFYRLKIEYRTLRARSVVSVAA